MKKMLLSLLVLLNGAVTANATVIPVHIDELAWSLDTLPVYRAGMKTSFGGLEMGLYKRYNASNVSVSADYFNLAPRGAFVVKSTTGAKITKVVLTCVSNKFTKDIYVYSTPKDSSKVTANTTTLTTTWSGAGLDSFVCCGVSSTSRVVSFEVTTSDVQNVENPTFSVPAGTYSTAQTVQLACSTAGATIYYTTDGTNPTASSTLYTSALNISKATPLKAIAVKDGEKSSVVYAKYIVPTTVAEVASYNALLYNTPVTFTSPVTAIYHAKSSADDTEPIYLYVKDDTGYMLIYGKTGQTYKNGDVIPGGFSGIKINYSSVPELKDSLKGFSAPTAGTAVEPIAMSVASVTVDDVNKYVSLKNVKYDYVSQYKIYARANKDSLLLYQRFPDVVLPTANGTYDIKGFVTIYIGQPEINVSEITLATGINELGADDKASETMFDLTGRHLTAPVKGQLYIKGHQKYIAK